jgi:uncharacterized protein
MNTLLRPILLPGMLLFALSSQTIADAFSDATHAYEAQDYTTAAKLFTQLAEQGNARAQHNLGLMYSYGFGVSQDVREAAKWFLRAAKQGLPQAQYDMGVMYATGQGVPHDLREAASWYIKAAHQNDAPAQFTIAEMYRKGMGVKRNDKLAVAWYRAAANNRFPKAQYTLGMMYAHGESGLPQDLVQAHKWLSLAGYEAIDSLQWVEGQMTAEQIKKAQSLEQEWQGKARLG